MSSAADQTAIFSQNLQSCGLLTDAQLRELSDWIAHKQPDVQALAKEVYRRGWLSPFQIKEIAKGRGAHLTVAGRYVLQDILGEGGMGRVYKAHDPRMGRDVAFKVIRKEKLTHPAAAGRFVQEIQALSKMSKHPNVIEVFIADQLKGSHYCVMEYIDGPDLTKMIRDRGPLPVAEACDIIRQTALGLEHAHAFGLVHRDIKPSNILVPRNGGPVKLVDLGLARVVNDPGDEAHRITQEGFVIGTPDFLAPEQARDPMGVGIRADIYALGGTLYYILTGRVPYEGNNATEKLIKHCTEPPPNLLLYRMDAPPQVEQIIHWAMAKLPEDRPQTPMQLAIALQPYCRPLTGATYSGLPPAPNGPLLSSPNPVPAARAVPGGSGASPAYPFPAPTPAYATPSPLEFPDPTPSSQTFKLPPQTTSADPIRRRSKREFPAGLFLVGLISVLVLGIIGYAGYTLFLRKEPPVPERFTTSSGLKMVRLEGGTFTMGSPDDEEGRGPDEGPTHTVTVRGPFFMSATEVTNSQFRQVMGFTPSKASSNARFPDELPVDSVTWEQANEFCRKLSVAEKDQPWARRGWVYRLPTEAEWEYAARAGTTTPFAFGDRLTWEEQGLYKLNAADPYQHLGKEKPNPSIYFGQAVGKSQANAFGLFDMHGNVAEWCSDWYSQEAYKDAPTDNPTGPTIGNMRVIRGGSFHHPATDARSAARSIAARDSSSPTSSFPYVGFRVVYAPVVK
jgi:eukaryotic-like serine/threonine-protein kinase